MASREEAEGLKAGLAYLWKLQESTIVEQRIYMTQKFSAKESSWINDVWSCLFTLTSTMEALQAPLYFLLPNSN